MFFNFLKINFCVGQGKCGVAVIRISGSDAELAIKKMTNIKNLKPRQAYLRNIKNPEDGEVIDRGLCLWFPGLLSLILISKNNISIDCLWEVLNL